MASILKKTPDDREERKENKSFTYSLVLVFLIPAAIIANTFWSLSKIQGDLNREIRGKAGLAQTVLAIFSRDLLTDQTALQEKIRSLIASDSELKEAMVLKPVGEGFEVIAGTDENLVGGVYKSLEYTKAFLVSQSTVILIASPENPRERLLVTLSTLKNNENKPSALLVTKISLAQSDAANRKTLIETLLILLVTVFLILLLLFNHFRFYQYALLLRRLKEVDKMKDDFISMASHELKTPMASMKGYMSMIFEGVAGKIDKKALEHLKLIMANIKRLDALINALLDVSRIEQKRLQFDMQAVDVQNILNPLLGDFTNQAKEKKLRLSYQVLAKPHPFIFADPERLTQIFDNIITNAIKYTLKGTITIYHRLEGNTLMTYFADTGVGISKEDLKCLFQKFFRVKNPKTAEVGGTGLGLWIARELAEKMNGKISVISQENIGSTFIVSFPIMKEK